MLCADPYLCLLDNLVWHLSMNEPDANNTRSGELEMSHTCIRESLSVHATLKMKLYGADE